MQYHKLIEKSLGAPSNMTYSLNNIVPTPIRVHTQISAVHSSKIPTIAGEPSRTLRAYIRLLTPHGSNKLPWEKVYEAEAQIWQRAMNLNGSKIDVRDAKAIIDNFL